MTAVALSIAGSDPSGGAGVQADIKTFSALGAYGTAVITALTAQSTAGVRGVRPVPASFVREQLEVLLDDVEVHAVKTGMLASAEVVAEVAQVLGQRPTGVLVCDPVMVATSGDRLLDDDAVDVVRTALLPLADVLTPNVPEAAVLLGRPRATTDRELVDQAQALRAMGPRAVLVKGGHLQGPTSVDVLATATGTALVRRPRVDTRGTHGTGCALSSAIAALAAVRRPVTDEQAWGAVVEDARDYLHEALLGGRDLGVGQGHGPVHHLARWW